MTILTLSDFSYELAPHRIAVTPARPRDSAKLLHVSESFSDHLVSDLPAILRPGDLIVVNDTRVIPAQLTAWRGEARIGVTLDRPVGVGAWRVLLRNAKRVRSGDLLTIGEGFCATVAEILDGGAAVLVFNVEGDDFMAALRDVGALALPPYIARPAGLLVEDAADYQTMFAAHDGAVAAPTAGLHFTPALVGKLVERGVAFAKLTLHVGAGTFLPVRTERLEEHRMHAERGVLAPEAAARINAVRAGGGRVVAVGTTVLRLLESAADGLGVVHSFVGETDIFILPGYRFKVVDLLFTNFHLPRSTLLMLVSAFAGVERIRLAYGHAVERDYRFYSYGDACLLERA